MPTAGCIMVSVKPSLEHAQGTVQLRWKNADNVKKLIAALFKDNAHNHLVIIVANLPHNYESWYPVEGYSELSPVDAQQKADQLGEMIRQDLASFIQIEYPMASFNIILWKDLGILPDYIKMIAGNAPYDPAVVKNSKVMFEKASQSIQAGINAQVADRLVNLNKEKQEQTGSALTNEQSTKLQNQSLKVVTEEVAQLFQMLERGLRVENDIYRIEVTWYMGILQKGSPLHVPFSRDTFPIICKVDPLSKVTFKQCYTNSMKKITSIRVAQQAANEAQEREEQEAAELHELQRCLVSVQTIVINFSFQLSSVTAPDERRQIIDAVHQLLNTFKSAAKKNPGLKLPPLNSPIIAAQPCSVETEGEATSSPQRFSPILATGQSALTHQGGILSPRNKDTPKQ